MSRRSHLQSVHFIMILVSSGGAWGEDEPPRLKGHVSDTSPFANLVRAAVPLSLFACLRIEGFLGGYRALWSGLTPDMMHTEARDDWRPNAIA